MKYSEITATWLKNIYFFGIDLTDENGNPMPDEIFELGIHQAKNYIESKTNVKLEPTEIKSELRDYIITDYSNWGYFSTYYKPVNEVTRLQIRYGSGTYSLPLDWIRIKKEQGIINLIPTASTYGTTIISSDGSFLPILFRRFSYVPAIIEIDYKAGFDDLPDLILNTIGMQATLNAFDILGDLVGGGAGIANYSISIDGLSQSVGTTSSPTNAGYGARILQYQKEIKENIKTIKAKYQGIPLSAG